MAPKIAYLSRRAPRLQEWHQTYQITPIFFLLLGNHSNYDKNTSPSNIYFQRLIQQIVQHHTIGIHPSYQSNHLDNQLKKEIQQLTTISRQPIHKSRQHFLKFDLPETYQILIDLEIEEDYSMGYASHVGFRASTCTPFYFYDLDFEIQTPLKIFPFAVMDTTLNDYMKLTPKQSLGRIRDLKNEVKRVNGTFITLFHNESLSNYLRWKG